jgi:hypothetical protein
MQLDESLYAAEQTLSPKQLETVLAEIEDADDVEAMRQAQREALETDQADLADYGNQGISIRATSVESSGAPTTLTTPASHTTTTATSEVASEAADEDEPGAIEEYMLRMAEWNFAANG